MCQMTQPLPRLCLETSGDPHTQWRKLNHVTMAYKSREELALPESNHSLFRFRFLAFWFFFSSSRTMRFLPLLVHCIDLSLPCTRQRPYPSPDSLPSELNAASYRSPLSDHYLNQGLENPHDRPCLISLLILVHSDAFPSLTNRISVPHGSKRMKNQKQNKTKSFFLFFSFFFHAYMVFCLKYV